MIGQRYHNSQEVSTGISEAFSAEQVRYSEFSRRPNATQYAYEQGADDNEEDDVDDGDVIRERSEGKYLFNVVFGQQKSIGTITFVIDNKH